MTNQPGLMIGEFARRCRLPISTLRYYDKIGLLTPTAIDPATGYRRYAIDQLASAVLISQLRAADVAPDSIGRIVTGGPTASVALLTERRRIASEIARAQNRLAQIDRLVAGGRPGTYRVDIVELAPRQVATLRFTVPLVTLQTEITRAIARLRSILRHDDHRRAGCWGATFPLELEEQVSGYVFTATQSPATGDHLETAWLPAMPAATTVHTDSVDTLPFAYHAAFATIETLGGSPSGPIVEEYPSLDAASTAVTQRINVLVPFEPEDQTTQERLAGPG
ncbi:MAG TPA: MerR family DNA-binding transcriptional regulator [Pseudonocardiaceae bacterium]